MTTTEIPLSRETRRYALAAASEQAAGIANEPDIKVRIQTMNAARHNIEACIESEVRAWREAGASWAEVGESLGLSRQGAQQRYSKRLY